MKKSFLKIVSLLLIIGLNYSGIFAVGETVACFNDIEISDNSVLQTGILNFGLISENDFSPEVTLGQKATRKIEVENYDSTMGFEYEVRVEENPVGDLCDYLYLEDGTSNEPLNGFVSEKVLFSEKQEWTFKASLDGTGEFWQNQECRFNLVFEGQQDDCNGFSDIEIIENTVTAGEFSEHLLISKVYYDVCDKEDGSCGEYKGEEPKHEWIELYNSTSQTINLKNWKICNNDQCETINPNNNSVNILPLGYAIIAHDASILKHWNILNTEAEATVIYQLGGNFQMENSSDMLILKDPSKITVDQMNWGAPNVNWDNYNNDLWNPGIPAVAEGHMLGRVPVGFDTDSPTDWYDLELPNVTVVYPREMDIVWHISGDYEIIWDAFYNNGNDDSELTIDIYYSNDSGKTWGIIEKGVENNGSYLWENIRPVIFTENGNFYSTLSSHARIKVVATDYTINFMLRGQDISDNDFRLLINCGLFTLEEIEALVEMGILDELECSTDSEDTKGSTALRDYGASDENEDSQEENLNDGASDEDNSDEENKAEDINDTDAKDEENVLDSEEKNLPDDEEDEDLKNEDDDEGDENNDDTDTDDMKEEDSDTDTNDGTNDDDNGDNGDSDDSAEEPAQDDGTNNELNNNMVDSVQASI